MSTEYEERKKAYTLPEMMECNAWQLYTLQYLTSSQQYVYLGMNFSVLESSSEDEKFSQIILSPMETIRKTFDKISKIFFPIILDTLGISGETD